MMYPSVPTTIMGPIKFFQPFAMASAAAVVGPPILALLARMMSSKFAFITLPARRDVNILNRTMMKTKTNNNGAFETINGMEAGMPMTTKNK